MGFFGDIASVLTTMFLSIWVAFLIPAGILLAVAYGGWFYFVPFLGANILLSYKFNKARKSDRAESMDDKHFGRVDKALDEYLSIIKKSQRDKEE